MQASLDLPRSPEFFNRYSSDEFADISGKLSEDFTRKAHVNEAYDTGSSRAEEDEKPQHDDSDEEEFSFACTNPDGSPISAEEVFENGQIRPIFPIFDQSLLFTAEGDDGDSNNYSKFSTGTASSLRPPLKKLFVQEREPPSYSSSSSETDEFEEDGPYCEWSGKAVEASPGRCKKSNSTGFSKLWRFRDLVHRSNSDGKDAFVFLSSPPRSTKKNNNNNNNEKESEKEEKREKVVVKEKGTGRKMKVKTTPSPHELHYVRNRALREEDRRRSYLPYKQGVVGVGFFTTVNGFSRNVHPF